MLRRRAGKLATASVLVSALVVLIPGSPVYLPTIWIPKYQHDGRSAQEWFERLDSQDPAERRAAVFAVGVIGPDASEAVPALASMLKEDANRFIRVEAALALSKMAPKTQDAVPALTGALADDELLVRAYAAIALLRLNTVARPAVPALIESIQDDRNQTNLDVFQSTIQEMAAQALARASAGSADGVPGLIAMLEAEGTDSMHLTAAFALGEIGPAARSAVPALRAKLRRNSRDMQRAAAEAMQKITGQPIDVKEVATAIAEMELPNADRHYIWEIEHHGNLLVHYGFAALAQALKDAGASALKRSLAADFSGTDLGKPRRICSSNEYAVVERLEESGQPPMALDGDAFVTRLLRLREIFGNNPPQVTFSLMSLNPRQRGQLKGAWEGTAQLRMHGEHAKGAPAEVVVVLGFWISQPARETITAAGWLQSASILQVSTAQSPRYLFAEVARQRGLVAEKLHDNWTDESFQPQPGGVYVCDFDRDGILDVLITDMNRCWLYRGRADGTFEDVTARLGLPSRNLRGNVAAWVDIDGDGWEDLILAGRFYRNLGGKRFVDYSDRCNLRLSFLTSGVVVADFDRDGKLDLYVTKPGRSGRQSWLDGKSNDSQGNVLLRNKGNWQFEDVTRASRAGGSRLSTCTAAWLDADNDGWPDLHVVNEFGDGTLLVNNRDGTFTPRRLAGRLADFGTLGLAVGDIDNDGNIDIYCANMYSRAGKRIMNNLRPDTFPPDVMERMRNFVSGSQLHLNRGKLKFEQAGTKMQVESVGWAFGACLADLDNDGWLDLYATSGFLSRNRDEPDGGNCLWLAVASQPFSRGTAVPAPGKVDASLGEFWVDNPWDLVVNGHSLSGFERKRAYLNVRGQAFLDISHLTGADTDGDSRSVVAADFRNAGMMDLIVRQAGGGPLLLFENRMPRKHYLKVSLRGTKSNRQGIGARLTAVVGGEQRVREMFPSNSFRSQAPNIVHFGLAGAEFVNRLTIRWPSGKVQVLEKVKADRHIIVDEGKEGASAVEIVVPGEKMLP